jgi:hypothetical protein
LEMETAPQSPTVGVNVAVEEAVVVGLAVEVAV